MQYGFRWHYWMLSGFWQRCPEVISYLSIIYKSFLKSVSKKCFISINKDPCPCESLQVCSGVVSDELGGIAKVIKCPHLPKGSGRAVPWLGKIIAKSRGCNSSFTFPPAWLEPELFINHLSGWVLCTCCLYHMWMLFQPSFTKICSFLTKFWVSISSQLASQISFKRPE